jgi:hypothetical protein
VGPVFGSERCLDPQMFLKLLFLTKANLSAAALYGFKE